MNILASLAAPARPVSLTKIQEHPEDLAYELKHRIEILCGLVDAMHQNI